MDRISDGDIQQDTLVWNATFGSEWKPAKKIPYLFQTEAPVEPDDCTPDMPIREIFNLGKESLTGFWEMFGIIFGVIGFIDALAFLMCVPSYTRFHWSLSLPVLCLVIAFHVPVYFGFQVMFLRTARGAMPFFTDIFRGLQNWRVYFRAWGATLWMWAFMAIWILVYLALRWELRRVLANEHVVAVLSWTGVVWIWRLFDLVAMAAIFVIYLTRYSMTYFILYGNRDISSFAAVLRSAALLRGFRVKLLRLYWKFACWLLPLAGMLWFSYNALLPYIAIRQRVILQWQLAFLLVFAAVYTCVYPHIRMSHAHFFRMLKKKDDE